MVRSGRVTSDASAEDAGAAASMTAWGIGAAAAATAFSSGAAAVTMAAILMSLTLPGWPGSGVKKAFRAAERAALYVSERLVTRALRWVA
jgi:hypothetical protein